MRARVPVRCAACANGGQMNSRSAQSWVSFGDRLRVEQQPTDYAPFVERFRQQGRFDH